MLEQLQSISGTQLTHSDFLQQEMKKSLHGACRILAEGARIMNKCRTMAIKARRLGNPQPPPLVHPSAKDYEGIRYTETPKPKRKQRGRKQRGLPQILTHAEVIVAKKKHLTKKKEALRIERRNTEPEQTVISPIRLWSQSTTSTTTSFAKDRDNRLRTAAEMTSQRSSPIVTNQAKQLKPRRKTRTLLAKKKKYNHARPLKTLVQENSPLTDIDSSNRQPATKDTRSLVRGKISLN